MLYTKAYETYCSFLRDTLKQQSVFVSPVLILLFMAHLKAKGLKACTISTYVSATRYVCKMHGWDDPGNNFMVATALSGLTKSDSVPDVRLPITVPILSKLLAVTPLVIACEFEAKMFKAMFSLAFFAFLRIGEFTARSASSLSLLERSSIVVDRQEPQNGFTLIFKQYKHNKKGRPTLVEILPQASECFCPVRLLTQYLALSPRNKGSLFQRADGSSVTRTYFTSVMRSLLEACSLDPTFYKGHSFRIGAASWAAQNGLSDQQIRQLGRWSSDAFKKYIRNVSFQV